MLLIILIAIVLSMDAFSLALAYGTLSFNKNKIKLISICVGLFHFFMPILGYFFGNIIITIIKTEPNIIEGIVFIILGIEMIESSYKKIVIKRLDSLCSYLLFSLSVSLDSFTMGIGFIGIKNNIFLCVTIFMITSFLFTYFGLLLGRKIKEKYESKATILGAIILIILGVKYLI